MTNKTDSKKNSKNDKRFQKQITKKRKIFKRRNTCEQIYTERGDQQSLDDEYENINFYSYDSQQIDLEDIREQVQQLEQNILIEDINKKNRIIELGKLLLLGVKYASSNHQVNKLFEYIVNQKKKNQQDYADIITNKSNIIASYINTKN